MALVKVSGYIQALAALLARKGLTIQPNLRQPNQMNRTLSAPQDGLNSMPRPGIENRLLAPPRIVHFI
jgi:hypothetical protein